MTERISPLAFVSYAWTDEAHKGRVKSLVERLRGDGVDAIFDQTHLRPGDDIFRFMEQIASNPDLRKVVVICDENYKRKVDLREGGSGTEGSIMSPEVYRQFGEGPNKYVAVAFEVDDQGNGFVPTMFASRRYIDMSSSDLLERNYERLLRFLWDRPEPAAPLGKPPAYLFDADPTDALVHAKSRAIEQALNNGRSILTHWHDFTDAILEVFSRFTAPIDEQRQYDDVEALRQAEWTLPARNELVTTMRFLIREGKLSASMLVSLLERLGHLSDQHEQQWSVPPEATAHTRATVLEMVLYLVAVMVQEDRPDLLGEVLNATYVYHRAFRLEEPTVFGFLWNDTRWFQQAYDHLREVKHQDATASWIKARADLPSIPFEELVQADALIAINAARAVRLELAAHFSYHEMWWPVLWPFWKPMAFRLFKRLVSKATLQRWLPVFRIDSVAAFREQGNAMFMLPHRDEPLGNITPEHAFLVSQLGTRP